MTPNSIKQVAVHLYLLIFSSGKFINILTRIPASSLVFHRMESDG